MDRVKKIINKLVMIRNTIMKKLLVLFVMLITTISISAQERNELQKIDSLQYKLDKLQHDYDFLDCDFKLYRLATDLKNLQNDLNTKANGILINCYHSRYDSMLYRAYKDNYAASEENLTSSEDLAFSTIMNVMVKMESSIFSEIEINVLNHAIKNVESSLSAAKSALNYYNVVLGIYKDLR